MWWIRENFWIDFWSFQKTLWINFEEYCANFEESLKNFRSTTQFWPVVADNNYGIGEVPRDRVGKFEFSMRINEDRHALFIFFMWATPSEIFDKTRAYLFPLHLSMVCLCFLLLFHSISAKTPPPMSILLSIGTLIRYSVDNCILPSKKNIYIYIYIWLPEPQIYIILKLFKSHITLSVRSKILKITLKIWMKISKIVRETIKNFANL